MNIVIPMAGMGKRLRPHTLTTPKPLIEVAGKSIVRRLCEDINQVVGEKIDEIGFIIGDFGKEVEERLLQIAEQLGAKGKIYYQNEPLGTAHAVWCARESLKGKVTVAFADTLFDAGFAMNTEEDGIIWTHKVEDPSAFGVVRKNDDETINGFVEKPKEFVSNEAIIGIYYFKSGENLLSELQYLIDNNITKSGEYQLTDALQNMLDKGLKFKTNDVKEWLDCGNPAATINTNQRVLELKSGKEQLVSRDVKSNNSVIIPPVYIGKGVSISNSVIGPYVSIAEGCEINDCRIENTMIGKQCILSKSVIAESMIGNNVNIKSNIKRLSIGDYSVVEL
ncbi:MAG: sugar phosphate nucleotidyltransferase [Bacteroidales bacterium]|nr:sugar phosphate nucleotidyltransferase [Bacteroidales bacterium]